MVLNAKKKITFFHYKKNYGFNSFSITGTTISSFGLSLVPGVKKELSVSPPIINFLMASFSLLSFETFVFSLLMFSSELVKSQSHEVKIMVKIVRIKNVRCLNSNRDYLNYRKCTNYLNKQAHLDYNFK
ncbi:hypothetical protein BpHYR1_000661 [Brachionus plicatilis]|uniref:Uncharacterized protein n=1 Tax=Brachionus plicatilis TaxID=10195 RepID=A0A3M7PJ98_BRAPC|nr:hypothetical protein BpHYR1_000661 [Brachionus plicatilis]